MFNQFGFEPTSAIAGLFFAFFIGVGLGLTIGIMRYMFLGIIERKGA